MKYTSQEQMEQILNRSAQLREEKERHRTGALSASAGALVLVLAVSIIALGRTGYVEEARGAYGAFLLSPDVGGYVLVAVLAFAVGVLLTVLIHRYRQRKNEEGSPHAPTE